MKELFTAIDYEDIYHVEELVNKGADLEVLDSMDYTPLHFAASRGYYNIVHLLLLRGARINPRSYDGSTPLDLASRKNHYKVEKLLWNSGGEYTGEKSIQIN